MQGRELFQLYMSSGIVLPVWFALLQVFSIIVNKAHLFRDVDSLGTFRRTLAASYAMAALCSGLYNA